MPRSISMSAETLDGFARPNIPGVSVHSRTLSQPFTFSNLAGIQDDNRPLFETTVSANLFCIVVCLVTYMNYTLLQPLLAPLMSAILASIVLGPQQKIVHDYLKSWTEQPIKTSKRVKIQEPLNSSVILKIFLLPLKSIAHLILLWTSDFVSHLQEPHELEAEMICTTRKSNSDIFFRFLSIIVIFYSSYLAIFVYFGIYNCLWLLLFSAVGVFVLASILLVYRLLSLLFRNKIRDLYCYVPTPIITMYDWVSAFLFDIKTITRKKMNEFLEENVREISSMIIVGFLVSVLFLGSMVITIGCLVESKILMDNTYIYINNVTSNITTFDELDYHAYAKNSLDTGMEWVEQKYGSEISGNFSALSNYVANRWFSPNASSSSHHEWNAFMTKRLPFTDSLFQAISDETQSVYYYMVSDCFYELSDFVKATFYTTDGVIYEQFKEFGGQFGNMLTNTGLAVTQLTYVFFGLFVYAFNTFVTGIIFMTTLFYLLSSETDIVALVLKTFFVDEEEAKKDISEAVFRSIHGVFTSTAKVFIFYLFWTGISFSMCDIELVFLPAVMSSFLAIVPFTSPLVFVAVGSLKLLATGRFFEYFFLVATHLFAAWFVVPAIYAEIPSSHPYIVGLSIFLGFSQFDFQGILLGPVLVCIPVIIYEMYQKLHKH